LRRYNASTLFWRVKGVKCSSGTVNGIAAAKAGSCEIGDQQESRDDGIG
jgi:hypothetical protein